MLSNLSFCRTNKQIATASKPMLAGALHLKKGPDCEHEHLVTFATGLSIYRTKHTNPFILEINDKLYPGHTGG